MSKTGGIIFARMNSTRLPGKALKMIEGITLLGRVINASLKINNIDHLCIATSSSPDDDKIELFAKKVGVAVYRGSEDDVIDRAIKASNKFKYQSFARICGDRPFINSEIYDELLLSHNKCNADITTNIFPRCVPFGLSAEIINVKSLGSITSLLTNNSEKEHITNFFYNNHYNYKINKVNHNNIFVEHISTRLVVDDENDLKKTRWMIKNHKKQKINVSTESLIEMDNQWQLNYSTNNINLK